MTTLTMNSLNAANSRSVPEFKMGQFTLAQFKMARFAKMRAALPQAPAEGSVMDHVSAVATSVGLAAVPFVALGWLFFAR